MDLSMKVESGRFNIFNDNIYDIYLTFKETQGIDAPTLAAPTDVVIEVSGLKIQYDQKSNNYEIVSVDYRPIYSLTEFQINTIINDGFIKPYRRMLGYQINKAIKRWIVSQSI